MNEKLAKKHRKILGPLGRLLLKVFRWEIKGKIPDLEKMILIGIPHTAMRDAWYALLAVWALDLKVNFFQGKHSSSSIGERISTKIESSMGFVAEGRSLSVLKNTKSVTLVINGNFYQYAIIDLLSCILEELKEIYRD